MRKVYNDNGIVINVTEYVHTTNDLYVILEIQNNTERKITLSEIGVSVNNRMDSQLFPEDNIYIDISAGSKTNKKIYFMNILETVVSEIDREVNNLEVIFDVYDSETYETICYPYIQMKTNKYDGTFKFVDYPTIYEDEDLKISFASAYWDTNEIYLYMYNKTDIWNDYQIDSLDVNDYTAGYTDFETNCVRLIISPNSGAAAVIRLNDTFLSDNKIDSVNKVRYDFRCFPEDDYHNDYSINGVELELDADGNYIEN